jgi:bifunctional enzyme CysN/CysC
VLPQTRRHAYIVSLIGVKQVVLAINKMDLVDYQKTVYDQIVADFSLLAGALEFESVTPIPIAALRGDNVTKRSAQTPWYQGPTVISALEALHPSRPLQCGAVFPVQWVNRPNGDFRGYSGSLVAGQMAVGDTVRVTASGQTAALSRIVTADGDLKTIEAGESVTLVLDRAVDNPGLRTAGDD